MPPKNWLDDMESVSSTNAFIHPQSYPVAGASECLLLKTQSCSVAAKSVAMAGALLARTSFISHPTQNNKSSALSATPRSRSVTARAQLANGSVTTSKATNGGFEEGELERPAWTGDEPLSRFVSSLIAIKPLFNVMKIGARQVLIRRVHALLRSCLCAFPASVERQKKRGREQVVWVRGN